MRPKPAVKTGRSPANKGRRYPATRHEQSGTTTFKTLSGGEAMAIGGAANPGITRSRVRVSNGPNVRVDGQVINGASGRQVTCVRR